MGANNKFKITTLIREMLLSDPKIKVMIGSKVFPLVATENTEGDFIVYQRDEYSKSRDKMGIHEQTCFVLINAVSTEYERSQDLACLIDDCLDGSFTNTDGTPMTIWLEDSTEEFTDGKYIQVLYYAIK